jgi:hypothetical protein
VAVVVATIVSGCAGDRGVSPIVTGRVGVGGVGVGAVIVVIVMIVSGCAGGRGVSPIVIVVIVIAGVVTVIGERRRPSSHGGSLVHREPARTGEQRRTG